MLTQRQACVWIDQEATVEVIAQTATVEGGLKTEVALELDVCGLAATAEGEQRTAVHLVPAGGLEVIAEVLKSIDGDGNETVVVQAAAGSQIEVDLDVRGAIAVDLLQEEDLPAEAEVASLKDVEPFGSAGVNRNLTKRNSRLSSKIAERLLRLDVANAMHGDILHTSSLNTLDVWTTRCASKIWNSWVSEYRLTMPIWTRLHPILQRLPQADDIALRV